MAKMQHNPLPVYIITKTGVGYTDEGIRDVSDFVLGPGTGGAGPDGYGIDESTTGIIAMSGPHLLNPDILAENLRENPTARVIVATRNDGSYSLMGYGPDEKGLPGVIKIMEYAREHNLTSHQALVRAARPDLEKELYPDVR